MSVYGVSIIHWLIQTTPERAIERIYLRYLLFLPESEVGRVSLGSAGRRRSALVRANLPPLPIMPINVG
jgi:hypothetical protein